MSKESVADAPSAPPTTAPLAATVATVSVMAVLVVGQMYVTIPLMPDLSHAWGVSTGSAAASTTAFAFTYAAGSLLSGPLSNRYGRRTVIVATVVAVAVLTVLVPLATSLTAGVVLRAVQGFFTGAFIPMVYAYLHDRIEKHRVSLALTVVSACLGATVVIGQVEAQVVAELLSWQWVFFLTAPLVLVGSVVCWRVLLPDTRPSAGGARARGSLAGLKDALGGRLIPLYLISAIAAGALTAVYTGVQLYGPVAAADDGGALLALRASALPALLGAVLLAPVVARVHAPRRAVGALVVAAVAMLVGAFGADSAVAVGAALFVFMAGFSTLGPALVQSIGARASAAVQTTAIAVYGFMLNVGAGAGVQLAALFDRFNPLALSLAVALVVATAGVLGGPRKT